MWLLLSTIWCGGSLCQNQVSNSPSSQHLPPRAYDWNFDGVSLSVMSGFSVLEAGKSSQGEWTRCFFPCQCCMFFVIWIF
jgi:hypothetical protein